MTNDKIADRRAYTWNEDEMESARSKGAPSRLNPPSSCLVEIFDGDEELFGLIR
jgi:hypothetical protein